MNSRFVSVIIFLIFIQISMATIFIVSDELALFQVEKPKLEKALTDYINKSYRGEPELCKLNNVGPIFKNDVKMAMDYTYICRNLNDKSEKSFVRTAVFNKSTNGKWYLVDTYKRNISQEQWGEMGNIPVN